MAGSVGLLGLAGRVAAILLLLLLCSCGGTESADPGAKSDIPGSVTLVSPTPITGRSTSPQVRVPDGPSLVDTDGTRLREDHAEVVRAVYRALAAGDLATLGKLYAGDDWAGQVALLSGEPVRKSVLDALARNPANLGEGYLYPGFAADPTTRYSGYRTAFFLDYDPPQTATGPLRWRGVAPGAPALVG